MNIAKRITDFDNVFEERNNLRSVLENKELENQELSSKVKVLEEDYNFGHPKGHFYSPIHKLEDLNCYSEVVKVSRENFASSIPGFSGKKIVKEFNKIKKYFNDFNYPKKDNGESGFYIENVSYPITDALILFSMIRYLKPKRIIEIGSGFTSALMMDVNKRFFNNKIKITFIEPYPELLLSRMNNEDKKKYRIIVKGVQEVPVKEFLKLEKGDVLFIDSAHVSKFNSDVNYELFNILPAIKSGVTIHFHDIFYGFEYPLKWLTEGWAWNEDYLLRAYLMGNKDYEVLLMNDYLCQKHKELLLKSFLKYPNNNGGSLWLKKINT